MSYLKKLIPLGAILIASIFMITSCNTQSKEQTAGIRMENMDTTVIFGDDFYAFATAGWQKLNPITAEFSRFGSFDKLAENNREQLKSLIMEIAGKSHPSGSVEQKIGDLYNLAMDSAKLNSDGISPIKEDIGKIMQLTDKDQLIALLPELIHEGISPYFHLYVDADPMQSDQYLLQTHQGGYALGQRDYYIDKDANSVEILKNYREFVAEMFQLTGFDANTAATMRDDVLKIETALAIASYDNVKLRNPHANYNKMNYEDLALLVPQLPWNAIFTTLGVKSNQISVSQKEHLIEVGKTIQNFDLNTHKSYLLWNLINSASDYLSDEINDRSFDFYGKVLSGKQEQQARWKRAVSAVDGSLGEAVGEMYVQKYFPSAAKERMLQLVNNLSGALGERINNLEWMGDSTKVKALEKLATFHVKIGYPDKWRDYSALEIKTDNYWENVKRINRFNNDFMFAKLGKLVDKDEWLMTPQTVNAYYNPSTNEICFPAGILQYPFFDMNADDAFNYGAIGVVIGHEMTHGFDDQGRQFDKDGNLNDWWTAEDASKFEKRAGSLADYFDKIEVAPGVFANGKFTLGENIAGQGGLQVSYQAFEKVLQTNPLEDKDGFTPQQRFFIAYANVWAGNIRSEEILKRTKTDPHSLGKWRVNAALPHVDTWYTAFNITPENKLYIAPQDRAVVW